MGEDEYPLTPRETSFRKSSNRSVKVERVNDEDDWTNIWDILDSKENDDDNVNESDDNANENNDNVNNNNEQNGHDVVEQIPVRQRKQPSRFQDYIMAKLAKTHTPRSYSQAIDRNDVEKWKEAYDKEIESLETVGEIKMIRRPLDKEVIPTHDIFEVKHDNITGKERYKVRIVARGDKQTERPPWTETFAPVVRSEAVRVFFATAAQYGTHVKQADISTAFLYGRTKKPVYLELPAGHSKNDGQRYVWESYTAIYGLDDASQV